MSSVSIAHTCAKTGSDCHSSHTGHVGDTLGGSGLPGSAGASQPICPSDEVAGRAQQQAVIAALCPSVGDVVLIVLDHVIGPAPGSREQRGL